MLVHSRARCPKKAGSASPLAAGITGWEGSSETSEQRGWERRSGVQNEPENEKARRKRPSGPVAIRGFRWNSAEMTLFARPNHRNTTAAEFFIRERVFGFGRGVGIHERRILKSGSAVKSKSGVAYTFAVPFAQSLAGVFMKSSRSLHGDREQ